MSSADKLERGGLEDEFRGRMHDAEVEPAPDLWSRIDHELTVKENKDYKDRIFMYKRLAAACFVLFMLAGALLVFDYKQELAPPASGIKTPATAQTEGIAAADNEPAAATNTAPAAGAELSDMPEKSTAPATTPAAPTTMRATERMAAAETSAPNRKATSRTGVQLKAGELLQILSEGEGAGAATLATAVGGTTDNGSEPTALPAAAGATERAETDKQAIQQMLRHAGTIMSMPKTQKPLKDQLAITAGSQTSEDSQADFIKKSIENLNASGKKAAEATGGGNSRMSLGMAYGPAYFNQNIGLPGQMMSSVSQNSLAAAGPRTSSFAADNMEAAREEYEDNTDAAFSYAIEARTGIRLNKHWKLLTGIGYSRNSARTKTTYVIRQYWFRPNTREPQELASTIFLPSLNNGFTTDSISVEQTDPFFVHYDYKLLSVPLGLQYEGKIAKDWYWFGTGGVAANFNLGSEIKAASAEIGNVRYSSHDSDSPFRQVQFSGNVGAGIGKRVSESVMVVIGPEFRSFFTTMLARPDEALAPQGKPYTIGVNMGIQYTLGKK